MIVKIAIGVTVILQIHKGFVSLQVITLSLKVTKKTLNWSIIKALANS